MLQVLHSKAARTPCFRVDGGAFLALALFSGLAGGYLGALMRSGIPGVSVGHGILLDLFVILPAFLGGMGRLVAPEGLNELPKGCRISDRFAFVLLLAGVICALQGIAMPFFICLSVFAWSVGVVLLSVTTVIRVLDCRVVRFSALCAFAWSQLLASLGAIVLVPVLLAGLSHDLLAGGSVTDTVSIWLMRIQTPLLSLSVQLALGAIASLVSFRPGPFRFVVPVLMAVMAVGVPVFWVHDLFAPSVSGLLLQPVGIALPSLILTGLVCTGVWRERIAPSVALFWSFPGLLLLSAGWIFLIFPERPEIFHSAMMFGVIFALFASYYRWQEEIPSLEAPCWLARLHLVSMGGAVMAMMPMFPFFSVIGESCMLICLFCVCTLGARLILPRRMAYQSAAR